MNLLKNYSLRDDTDVEKLAEFHRFLTGEEIPEGLKIGNAPALSKQQAFSVIWYLQEHLPVFPDNIDMCSYCGELYDSDKEGLYCEDAALHYCGHCDWMAPE